MLKTAIKIGPADHGQPMSLEDFEQAETQEGYLYELGRGVVIVSDVPKKPHLMRIERLRRQFYAHETNHPGAFAVLASTGECKILIAGFESERHPDLAMYKTEMPDLDENPWSIWIPALAIEIVSPGSENRDYIEKRQEYLAFGVQEYWIVDAAKQQILVLQRVAGLWRERVLGPTDTYRTPLLPGFELKCAPVLEVGEGD